jgi:DNA-binding PadR family transcriptional regulator
VVPSLIDHAVLALVIERPSYGYELYERFGRRFGEFLPASQGNVYDALKRLERVRGSTAV